MATLRLERQLPRQHVGSRRRSGNSISPSSSLAWSASCRGGTELKRREKKTLRATKYPPAEPGGSYFMLSRDNLRALCASARYQLAMTQRAVEARRRLARRRKERQDNDRVLKSSPKLSDVSATPPRRNRHRHVPLHTPNRESPRSPRLCERPHRGSARRQIHSAIDSKMIVQTLLQQRVGAGNCVRFGEHASHEQGKDAEHQQHASGLGNPDDRRAPCGGVAMIE